MKILMINKFFYIKGGSERYYFSLKKLLEDNGHIVIDFSMQDNKNFESKYSEYFVKNIDYNKKQSLFLKIKVGLKIIYSFEAKRKLKKLIKATKPDIAHLHIFQHQLTSSIIDVLKKYNIPIVYTAHDLKILCPNYKMLDNDGNVCELCNNNQYYKCFNKKCIKKSYSKSFIAMIEAYYNRLKNNYKKIDYIITPSKFYKDKIVEYGYDSDKVIHINNFLDGNDIKFDNSIESNYYLYFGRLSEEKGIFTLIKAIKNTNLNLKIVGTGPIEEEIKKYLIKNNISNIELLGYKKDFELYTIIGNSKCIIIPSEWYENGPYSVIESLKLGKPIIGSNIGGIPELIKNNKNGYIFQAGNIDELNKCLNKFENLSDKEIKQFGEYSLKIFNEYYTSDIHYKKLMNIYNKLIY